MLGDSAYFYLVSLHIYTSPQCRMKSNLTRKHSLFQLNILDNLQVQRSGYFVKASYALNPTELRILDKLTINLG